MFYLSECFCPVTPNRQFDHGSNSTIFLFKYVNFDFDFDFSRIQLPIIGELKNVAFQTFLVSLRIFIEVRSHYIVVIKSIISGGRIRLVNV